MLTYILCYHDNVFTSNLHKQIIKKDQSLLIHVQFKFNMLHLVLKNEIIIITISNRFYVQSCALRCRNRGFPINSKRVVEDYQGTFLPSMLWSEVKTFPPGATLAAIMEFGLTDINSFCRRSCKDYSIKYWSSNHSRLFPQMVMFCHCFVTDVVVCRL